MNTVAIIPKRTKPEALALAAQVAAWLKERGRTVLSETGTEVDGTQAVGPEELAARAQLIVVLGGDGTLLHASRLCERREVPILGINMGSLGFLTEINSADTFAALERVLAGDYSLKRRSKLRVRVVREGQNLVDTEVLNDVVIGKNLLARIASIDVSVGGSLLTAFNADGVIVATPTGSSAYALAAGGPLVHPAVPAVLIVPICPHTLSERPILVPDDREIEMVLASDSEMFVTLDGQVGRALQLGDRVVVVRAATVALIVRNESMNWYAMLRTKLKWGQR